jgi:UDP-2,3-diacylglucosamine hydrolase
MKQDLLFISDLHLSLEKTEITRRFLGFLQQRAGKAKAVYILGDLFDAWIGDDDNTPPNPAIKKALRQLTASGTAVYLLQGNRDFLLGAAFCAETGIRLLDEYAVIGLDAGQALLTHGDLLCTDDLPYQAFRLKSHSQKWQQFVLSKPLFIRLLAARWYRFRSYFHKRNKSQEIMDVNQQTVVDVMTKFNCHTLIHGHTHRPALHEFTLAGQPAKRLVLAEWKRDGAQVLCWSQGEWRRENL